jgi:hypothetical protein
LKQATRGTVSSLVLGVVGLLLVSCESTDVGLPAGSVINMSASPGTVRIEDQEQATSVVTATVFDERNLPRQDVTIKFESTADLEDDPAVTVTSAETDRNGRAETTLEVTRNDAGQVTVTGRVGALTGEVVVNVDVVEDNEPPRAVLTIVPNASGQIDQIISFDGSGSLDPDGSITCYRWELLSEPPDVDFSGNPLPRFEIIQGTTLSRFNKSFNTVKTLTVTLWVSDWPDGPTWCSTIDEYFDAAPPPDERFGDNEVSKAEADYEISCTNPPPTAIIAGPAIIYATTADTVRLNGTLSYDLETGIDEYIWYCDVDDDEPTQQGPLPFVDCGYSTKGTYVASLVVTDRGTGVIPPGSEEYDCWKASEPATVTIVVRDP